MKIVARVVLLLALLLPAFAGRISAAPLTTKYYSLDLPPDWVVVNGPTKQNDAVQVLLGQKDHKTSAAVIVGPAKPGDAEKAAEAVHGTRLAGRGQVFRGPRGRWRRGGREAVFVITLMRVLPRVVTNTNRELS